MTSETSAIPTPLPFPAPIILQANENRLPRINQANNLLLNQEPINPSDLATDQGEQESDELEPLLALLDEKPLTVGEWEKAANDEGYSRATFFRIKKRLESDKLFQFNRIDKKCSRSPQGIVDVKIDPVGDCQPPEAPESVEIVPRPIEEQTAGVRETIDTTETVLVSGVKFQVGQPVSSLTSPEIAFAQYLMQTVNNDKNSFEKQQRKHDQSTTRH